MRKRKRLGASHCPNCGHAFYASQEWLRRDLAERYPQDTPKEIEKMTVKIITKLISKKIAEMNREAARNLASTWNKGKKG